MGPSRKSMRVYNQILASIHDPHLRRRKICNLWRDQTGTQSRAMFTTREVNEEDLHPAVRRGKLDVLGGGGGRCPSAISYSESGEHTCIMDYPTETKPASKGW